MSEKKEQLWSPKFIAAIVMVVCIIVPMTYCMPMLPIYIQSIGGDAAKAGLIVSAFNLISMVCRPISAWVIDNSKKKPVMIFAFCCVIIGCFCYQLAAAVALLLALRAVHAIGYSAGSNAAGVIVTGVLPDQHKRAGLGYYGFAISASIAIGPVIALTMMHLTSIKGSFIGCAVIAAVGLVIAVCLGFSDQAPVKRSKFSLKNCYELTAVPRTLVMTLTFFAYSGLATYLTLYTTSLGIGNISIYFYLMLAAGMIIAKLVSDTVLKTKDTTPLLFVSIAAMVIALALLSAATSVPLFLAIGFVFGLGFCTLQSGLLTQVMMNSPAERRGASNSTFLSSGDVGMSVGPVVWGTIAAKMGYSTVYRFGAVVMALDVLLLIIVLKAGEREKKAA